MMVRNILVAALMAASVAIVAPASAQQAPAGSGKVAKGSDDKMASSAEKQRVLETIGKIGCRADEVEKESEDLFEVDDAKCDIGQFDIKLNGQFQITSMTRDAPSGTDADGKASSAEVQRVLEVIAKIGCRADEVEKESNDLFEVDDAQCDMGRFDIKLDGQFQIISAIRD